MVLETWQSEEKINWKSEKPGGLNYDSSLVMGFYWFIPVSQVEFTYVKLLSKKKKIKQNPEQLKPPIL